MSFALKFRKPAQEPWHKKYFCCLFSKTNTSYLLQVWQTTFLSLCSRHSVWPELPPDGDLPPALPLVISRGRIASEQRSILGLHVFYIVFSLVVLFAFIIPIAVFVVAAGAAIAYLWAYCPSPCIKGCFKIHFLFIDLSVTCFSEWRYRS